MLTWACVTSCLFCTTFRMLSHLPKTKNIFVSLIVVAIRCANHICILCIVRWVAHLALGKYTPSRLCWTPLTRPSAPSRFPKISMAIGKTLHSLWGDTICGQCTSRTIKWSYYGDVEMWLDLVAQVKLDCTSPYFHTCNVWSTSLFSYTLSMFYL